MSKNKKTRKKWIIASVTIVLIAAFALGLWFFVQYQNDSKTVEVIPVMNASTTYWADQSSSSGTVVSNYAQELYVSNDKVISEIFVEEGQEVHIGDALLQYDKTKLELDVESKEIAVKEVDLEIDTAQKQLKKLQNTKPAATAKPTSRPTGKPTATPRPTARPTASPSPTPVPPADVTLYSRLDLDSKPYAGSGTTDDPYIFLCTEDCTMTPDFLKWLLGAGAEPAPTPTPAPTPEPEGDGGDGEEETPGEDTPSTPTPTPTPEPKPESDLASPFAAVFEVRDGNSNYGQLISAFKLDGTQLSANFQISDMITGSNTIDSVAGMFGATPTPTPNANNYNNMGYTSSELKQLINEKKQEIQTLQLKLKQAKLNLEKANLQLKNSTVLSNVDGVVRTLIDQDTAAANNQPFLVVSGDEKYYISGVLSENLLGRVNVGDTVSVMSYQNGMTYTAQVVSIADYPLDSDSGMYYYSGTGNPNSSNYEFTSVLEGGEDLQNGMNVQITMDVPSEDDADALYLDKAYLRDDDAGTYVMKAGIDNRLIKQYVQTGKSIYSGSYLEIQSGLTIDDYIAFPYGPDVKERVRVRVQGSEEGPNPDGAMSEPVTSLPPAASGEDSGFLDDEDGEGSGTADSGVSSEAPPEGEAEALPDGAIITGRTEEGTTFKTENGGGVILS